ncbi:MAG: zf-HC2 domain-containing protein [Pirellulales bacterium]
MAQPQKPVAAEARETLVAYLDGELSSAERQRVEQQLATDPAFRAELTRLEQVWGLLDELPRAAADDTFTRSTVEMVAVRAAQERAAPPRPPWSGWIVWGGGLALAAAIGFFALWLRSSENEVLLRDLPVIQDLDAYERAGSIEFLQLLVDRRVFEETGDGQ